MFNALVFFEMITKHMGIDLVVVANRFSVLTLKPRFVSFDVISSSDLSVVMPLIKTFIMGSSGSVNVEKSIVFSLNVFWI